MSADQIPALSSVWAAFLDEVDRSLPEPVELHCIGGFVVSQLYGFPRPTGDVDYVTAIPHDRVADLEELAGRGSNLEKRFRIHLQHVTVVDHARGLRIPPGQYISRPLYKTFAPGARSLRSRAI